MASRLRGLHLRAFGRNRSTPVALFLVRVRSFNAAAAKKENEGKQLKAKASITSHLSIIGCGKMAEAMCKGLLASSSVDESCIHVFDPNQKSNLKPDFYKEIYILEFC